ncbi:MAG: DUF1269 domain-containing protein [Xenococcus sp. (in: cyanobacteria)]
MGFNEKYKADEIMLDLLKKEQQHLADLEDAVVVTKNSQGKIRVKPYYDILAAVQGHKSQFWGSIISSLLETSDPETLSKIGLNEQIRSEIREIMQPNSSIIIVLFEKINFEKALAEIDKYQGKLLYTTLAYETKDELYQALS